MNGSEGLRRLFIIRVAFILGVATFAGITVFLRSQGMLPTPDAQQVAYAEKLRYAVWAMSAFAVAWALLWKVRAEAAMTEERLNAALIVGWAPGNGTALLAIVTHFLGGPIATMAFGILAFVVVLLVLRIPTPPR